MIVNAEILIKNYTDPNLIAHIANHPSIIERGVIHYLYNQGDVKITTRLQIEAQSLAQAELIFIDALTIDEEMDIPVDESSVPLITVTEIREGL